MPRCAWATDVPDYYQRYHDEEWGVPCFDERAMFEMQILEGAQAGLSWQTILAKRDNYRRAFDNFDVDLIAGYGENKVQALMQDAGIVRNQLKIRATIHNAQALLRLRETAERPALALSDFYWKHVDGRPRQNRLRGRADVQPSTPVSDQLSKSLKKAGFKFIGSTIVYAHMQACGMVNDHTLDCDCHDRVLKLGLAI